MTSGKCELLCPGDARKGRHLIIGRYIPSELGYGDSGSPPKIKGGDPLVFQMEIIKIKVRGMALNALRLCLR